MAYLLVVRPLRKLDLERALQGSPYSASSGATGVQGEVWIMGPGGPTPEALDEIRGLIRDVPLMRRKLRNPHYFTIRPEDWKCLQEERITSNSWHTMVCPYSIGQANWSSLNCPSGITYVLCLPTQPKGAPYYLHSWCLTSEWVPPPDDPKTPGPSTVWPAATAEPVIQIAKLSGG